MWNIDRKRALNINGDTLTIASENNALTAKRLLPEGARVLMNTTLGLSATAILLAAGTLTMTRRQARFTTAIQRCRTELNSKRLTSR